MERSQEDFLDFQTQESQKVKETFEGKKIIEKVEMKDKGSTFFVLARFTGM